MEDDELANRVAAIARLEKGIKRGVRFCVEGPDGNYSGVWFAWANGSDYYIGARSILGSMKVSLHASGICRVALLQTQIDEMVRLGLPVPADRALIKWTRPPTPLIDAVLVASVKFPATYLRSKPHEGKPGKSLIVFQVPPGAQAAQVDFIYTREHEDTLYDKVKKIGQPMFFTKLDNGDSVWMVARLTEFTRAELPTKETMGQANGKPLSEAFFHDENNLHGVFWNRPNDGGKLEIVEVGGVRLTQGKFELEE